MSKQEVLGQAKCLKRVRNIPLVLQELCSFTFQIRPVILFRGQTDCQVSEDFTKVKDKTSVLSFLRGENEALDEILSMMSQPSPRLPQQSPLHSCSTVGNYPSVIITYFLLAGASPPSWRPPPSVLGSQSGTLNTLEQQNDALSVYLLPSPHTDLINTLSGISLVRSLLSQNPFCWGQISIVWNLKQRMYLITSDHMFGTGTFAYDGI